MSLIWNFVGRSYASLSLLLVTELLEVGNKCLSSVNQTFRARC